MSPQKNHIVVTGASGFVGTHVMRALAEAGEYPVGLTRKPAKGLVHGFDLGNIGDLSKVLTGAKAVVHCAARVHGRDDKKTALAQHRRDNRDAVAALIAQAEAAGVGHFVFLSTVAVYGLRSSDQVISFDHPVAPNSPYAQGKLEAEEIVRTSGMRTTILRVPLVYGPHAPGLWRRFHKLCDSAAPLPFAYCNAPRSMMAVQNLADLIRHCILDPNAPQDILASDHDDLTATTIARTLRKALGRPERLFPLPLPLLKASATVLRRPYLYDNFFAPLRLAPTDFGWQPKYSAKEALGLTVPRARAGDLTDV
ncbi:NAD-dependent epimerase/dehydratase family protein [Cognatishimia sp. SS12]|uniref:NAD-dependent epimerase/dehydratase family protein n=1 Tax=Cognatishimia sp. SS12 TaxID=2979465 RepID=UPI00232DFC95|nr:NAD-dependent epimerase/dehydratase family protein [Cognatishimia sp. SS12]MDC0737098.1 NAD-dependent epimerase/dehydratase family protein [Cognatishimia sp. SS12]